ncbi:hypothetical protein BpHYR1_033755 [Brachionus plicatilis]|uniref:Uncharacterized protein n=1 Tax=Brachionus plicatilis TaxID=10195 RepID=A0A3M7T237_BRAPC|nr:hypothetical protein BpHYR1_033755 [Brachionus plicatilis]
MRELIDFNVLRRQNATHVIVSIIWGGNAIASFEHQNKKSKNKQEIEGTFKAAFSKIKALVDLSANANIETERKESTVLNETNVKFKADMVSDEELPTTVEEAINFLKKFPSKLLQTNKGKGVPLEFELLSLNEIKRLFQIDIECDLDLRPISLKIISQIENEFDDLLEKKQKLNDMIDECVMYEKYLNQTNKQILLDLKQKISNEEDNFKESISKILLQVKSGKSEPTEISNQLLKFQQTDFSSKGLEQKLKSNQIQIIRKKIQFLKNIIDSKICIFEKTMTDINIFVNSNELRDKEVYIFKTSDEFKNQDKQMYDDYFDYFWSLRRTKNEASFYLFDYDMHNNYENKILCIEHFKGGRKMNKDCFEKTSELGTVELSGKISLQLVQEKREDELIHLMVRCPNIDCPNIKIKWKCKKCDQVIQYGKSLKFYCDCYSVDCSNFKFKCPSPDHPEGMFLKFSDQDLKRFLSIQFNSQKSIIWACRGSDFYKQCLNKIKEKVNDVKVIDSSEDLEIQLENLSKKVILIVSVNFLCEYLLKTFNSENVLQVLVLYPVDSILYADFLKTLYSRFESSMFPMIEKGFTFCNDEKMLIDSLNLC